MYYVHAHSWIQAYLNRCKGLICISLNLSVIRTVCVLILLVFLFILTRTRKRNFRIFYLLWNCVALGQTVYFEKKKKEQSQRNKWNILWRKIVLLREWKKIYQIWKQAMNILIRRLAVIVQHSLVSNWLDWKRNFTRKTMCHGHNDVN